MNELDVFVSDTKVRVSEVMEHIAVLQQYVSNEMTSIESAIEHYGEAATWQNELLKESRRPHLITLSMLSSINSYVKAVQTDINTIQEITKSPIQSDQTAE